MHQGMVDITDDENADWLRFPERRAFWDEVFEKLEEDDEAESG